MAPKNNAKGAAKGKGKDADDKGKGKGAVKGAQTIQVRHILV
jgi:NIMA-interacting peptidyl-prolyl cis-trans isomerase 4